MAIPILIGAFVTIPKSLERKESWKSEDELKPPKLQYC